MTANPYRLGKTPYESGELAAKELISRAPKEPQPFEAYTEMGNTTIAGALEDIGEGDVMAAWHAGFMEVFMPWMAGQLKERN